MTQEPTPKPLKTLSGLTSPIYSTWDAVLRTEGFGQRNMRDPNAPPDVGAEIESMVDYQRIMSFYGTSKYDLENRERFLHDYVRSTFSDATITRSVLPRSSFLPKIVRNIAMLYRENPARWVTASDGEVMEDADAAYQGMRDASSLDVAMKSVYKKAVATNLVLVRPRVSMHADGSRADHLILTPNTSRVMLDDNGDVVKVLYSAPWYDDGFSEYVIVVWTRDEHYILDHHAHRKVIPVNPDGVNPYGVIPFALCQLERDDADVYSGGMHDVVDSCLRYNFLKLLQNGDITFAATGAWLATNMELGAAASISPSALYAYDEVRAGESQYTPPTLENISGEPHSELIGTLMRDEMRATAVEQGISPAMLENEMAELSGKALRQMQRELLDRRLNDAETMQEFEARLFDVQRIVWDVERRAKRLTVYVGDIPQEAKLNVDFSETIETDLDEKEQYDLDREKVKDGLMSLADWYRKHNTDVDDEDEILARIKRNREEMRTLGAQGGLLKFLDNQSADNQRGTGDSGNLDGNDDGTDDNAMSILAPNA